MWKKDIQALRQRRVKANALKSVIVLKHTYSDSTVNKFIYSYLKGGWELHCFRYASYIKGPLIFYYLKKQERTGKIWLSTVKLCTSFCSSNCYDIKCNTWKHKRRTEESLLQLHRALFLFHKAALGSVSTQKLSEERETLMRKATFLSVSWMTDHPPFPLNTQALASCSPTVT